MSTALGPYSRTNNFVFDPSQVSGLALWLDAADDATVIRTGTNVTRWNDKSGSNNTAVAGTATYPIYSPNSLNSLPVIQLRAANDYFIVSNNFTYSAYPSLTYFIVMKPFGTQLSISALGVLSTDTPNFFGRSLMLNGANGNYRQEYYSNFLDITPYSSTRWDVVSMQFNTTVSATFTLNGTLFNLTPTTVGSNTSAFIIGSAPNSPYTTFNANLDIGEILVYGASLTTTQRQQIESYLAWKWNLQRNLPTTHPYYNSPYVAYNQIVNIPQQIIDTNTVFPNQISGLSLWLDAADDATVIRTGSAVTRWDDKSGNIRNLTTVLIGAGTITYTNVSLVFSNTAYMFINTPVNLQNFTVFFIGKTLVTSGSANNQMIFCVRPSSGFSYNSADGLGLYYDYTATKQTRFYGAGFVPMQDTVTFVNPVLNCYTQNAAGSLSSFLYGSNTSNVVTTARTTTGQGFAVGAEASSGGYGSSIANNYFQMNEVIVYNTVLSTTQRQQIEGYLAYKWSLKSNLPVSHPTYTPSFVPSGSINVKPYIWVPTQISGCALWLDAADANSVVRTGSNVSQWNDKSGNVRNATATQANPTYVINSLNGLPILRFSNPTVSYSASYQTQFLTVPVFNFGATTTRTIFSVANVSATRSYDFNSTWEAILAWRGTHAGMFINKANISQFLLNGTWWNSTNTAGIEAQTNINSNVPLLLCDTFSISGSTATATNFVNATLGTVATASMTGFANSYTSLTIGCARPYTVSNGYNWLYNGDIAEILVYQGDLTTTQREQIEGYLAWKWNLQKSLPSSHPFFNFPPG